MKLRKNFSVEEVLIMDLVDPNLVHLLFIQILMIINNMMILGKDNSKMGQATLIIILDIHKVT